MAENSGRRLLIIDDEENMRHMLTVLTRTAGYQVECAADGREAMDKLVASPFDFVLCDLKMPKMTGMAFLAAARDLLSGSTVIMMSAYGTIDLAIEAMKQGAYDFISKPFKPDEVLLALKKAEEREALRRENLQLRDRIRSFEGEDRFGAMLGKSRAMRKVFDLGNKVAVFDTTVLITGESGTGKELVARAIHLASKRAARPMVAVNCGGIPDNLLESELFGHVKGAFTGADRTRKGLFEEADGSTLLLDEIGELPLPLQVKLLRALQENEIRPVGGAESRKVDVRVLAATSRDLKEAINGGLFREVLYYRLHVMTIVLPPLRERRDDIPLLVQHFINRFTLSMAKPIKGVARPAMNVLMEYGWPGNVRELENVIERAMVLADTNMLQVAQLPAELTAQGSRECLEGMFEGYSIKKAKPVMERLLIAKALATTSGNRSRAAELLEISYPALLAKITEYKL
ncbi:MAG: hypothetical protein COZ12_09090 [Deltaproteobacteria bacterium CG_4_10_14_3_um_filter_60_8]|nr:MAG: hypothetical protein COZ12_09090 [Deltaproteobacteria bacterium CG_4_10_14_3_um_filter_60_8]